MPHDFEDRNYFTHFPDGEFSPDGEPSRWDQYELYRCKNCGREAWGLVDSFLDEKGRREETRDLPIVGEYPNEGVRPECDPGEVEVWAVMGP